MILCWLTGLLVASGGPGTDDLIGLFIFLENEKGRSSLAQS